MSAAGRLWCSDKQSLRAPVRDSNPQRFARQAIYKARARRLSDGTNGAVHFARRKNAIGKGFLHVTISLSRRPHRRSGERHQRFARPRLGLARRPRRSRGAKYRKARAARRRNRGVGIRRRRDRCENRREPLRARNGSDRRARRRRLQRQPSRPRAAGGARSGGGAESHRGQRLWRLSRRPAGRQAHDSPRARGDPASPARRRA